MWISELTVLDLPLEESGRCSLVLRGEESVLECLAKGKPQEERRSFLILLGGGGSSVEVESLSCAGRCVSEVYT